MSDENIRQKTILMRNGDMRMSRDREYWTDEEKEILGREYKNGTSINEIALMLNRSESAVHQKIEQQGLCVRNPFSMRKRSGSKKDCKCLCENCKCDRSLCPRCKVYETILEDM